MCKNNVCIVPLVVAILLAIGVGALFFSGIITTEILFTPLLIGTVFATIALILLYVTAAFGVKKEVKERICSYGGCLALGGLLTIITGFVALTAITLLVVGSILSTLLLGLFAFAFVLTFLSFAGLIVCLVRSNCRKMNVYCKFENDYTE